MKKTLKNPIFYGLLLCIVLLVVDAAKHAHPIFFAYDVLLVLLWGGIYVWSIKPFKGKHVGKF